MLSVWICLSVTFGDKLDSAFRGFDIAVFRLFGALQNSGFTWIAKAFTALGDENFVLPVAVLGVVLCLFKRTRRYGMALVFSIVIGTMITNVIVKPMVLRIRPYNTLQTVPAIWTEYQKWYQAAGTLAESDYSFPSGHTTAAFEMATAMFLCFRNRAKTLALQGEKTRLKTTAWIFLPLAAGTMISRIYLMVHYPTDVLAGMLVGLFAGAAGYGLARLGETVLQKMKFTEWIDAEKLLRKPISARVTTIVLCITLCVFYAYSFVPAMQEGNKPKCAYNMQYDCQNEARIDDEEYPAIDSDGDGTPEYYCKLHWKELCGE